MFQLGVFVLACLCLCNTVLGGASSLMLGMCLLRLRKRTFDESRLPGSALWSSFNAAEMQPASHQQQPEIGDNDGVALADGDDRFSDVSFDATS